MLKDLKVSRRMALRGVVAGTGIAMSLPVLDAMMDDNGEAFAQGSPLPTPFGIWFWGNGVYHSHYLPKGNNFTLERNLESFAAVKDKMTLLSGLDMLDGGFRGHGLGIPYVLCGGNHSRANRIGDIDFLGGFERNTSGHSSSTMDQIVADHYQQLAPAPFKSLETGTLPYTGMNLGTMSRTLAHRAVGDGKATELSPERDPSALYDRLFADANVPATPNRVPSSVITSLRRSSLDAVNADIARLKLKVGALDSSRLDSHFEGIRAIENRLSLLMDPGDEGGGCAVPTKPGKINIGNAMQVTARAEAMNRLIAAALACNLTNVFSHLWSGGRDDNTYPLANENSEHHGLTHSNDAAQRRASDVTRFILTHLADLAEVMDETPMGNGTLLDRSLIYAVTEMSNPRTHRHFDYIMLLLGGAGGKLRGNQHVAYDRKKKMTQVQLTMLQTLGLPIETWGTWDRTSDGVSEFLA